MLALIPEFYVRGVQIPITGIRNNLHRLPMHVDVQSKATGGSA